MADLLAMANAQRGGAKKPPKPAWRPEHYRAEIDKAERRAAFARQLEEQAERVLAARAST